MGKDRHVVHDLLLVVPSFLIIAIMSQKAGASKGSITCYRAVGWFRMDAYRACGALYDLER